jgi:DNA ligase (NAD+)
MNNNFLIKNIKIKNRIEKLRTEISRLRSLYHIENDPNITDDVYESLLKELNSLLEKYPEFNNLESFENRVGGRPLDKFDKFKHEIKMYSIGNIFSEDDFFLWQKRNQKLLPTIKEIDYFCELKLDGLAVSLFYEDGHFIRGLTRGDGVIGEDITSNLHMIKSIPLTLQTPFPPRIEVRGEVILMKEVFEKLNQENEKAGKPLFANSRNAAAGSLRQLDPSIVKDRELDFFAYEIAQIKGLDWQIYMEKHSTKHDLLKRLGFLVENHSKLFKKPQEIFIYIEKIAKIRENLPMNIDGVVININQTSLFEKLGVVGKDPRGIIAYKYPAERATTTILDIKMNVGRTGVLTPVADFKPTLVAGSVVSKATLHNFDQINRLDIRIGDTVIIQKAGDVIPEVVEVLVKLRNGHEKKIKIPTNCPVCQAKVEQRNVSGKDNSVAFYCINKNCPARNQRAFEHFVNIFEIYEIGPKIITRLKDEGLITDVADLFILEEADLAGLERFGQKSAENIISSIQSHKKISFWRFIYALGIIHVGEQTAQDLAKHFNNIEEIKKASLGEIIEIENIGPIVGQSIYNYFQDKININLINKLFKNGVEIIKQENKRKKFENQIFVLTGTLSSIGRGEAKKKIIENGGKVSSSVSAKTNYLIAGDKPGSKYKEAEKLKVPIISEKEFLNLINT